MRIGIAREITAGERRVAASPQTVEKLVERGHEVIIEAGAGEASEFSDEVFESAGARMVASVEEVFGADVVLKVNAPIDRGADGHEADLLGEGTLLISFVWPSQSEELVARLAARKVDVLAMDKVPRITRAQKMDALSSMANIAGYRAVVEAAQHYGSFFSGQITAAGRVPPAHVMIVGAGVAGLAAIGAARGLGAVVRAFDTREAVREQVQSLGAQFIDFHFEESGEGEGGYAKEMSDAFIKAEQDLLAANAAEVDIIITTALIPGRPAPVLITEEAVEGMKPGSVIVDLAAARGGNCPLSVADEVVRVHDVTLVGYTDLPSRMAQQSSLLYATNVYNLLDEVLLASEEKISLDHDNEVVRGALILEDGEVMWPPPKVEPKAPAVKADSQKGEGSKPASKPSADPARKARPARAASRKSSGHGHGAESSPPSKWSGVLVGLFAVVLMALGYAAPSAFLSHLTIFLLACIVGWHVVWNVSAALHTPLMSVTNAISGIILLGGMLLVKGGDLTTATILSLVAVLVASINVAGGFLVTQRMLRMFRR